jgi:hypothetical protein
MSRQSFLSNTAALTVFVVFALWTLSRLAGEMHQAIPGDHAGDNVASLWNVWWFTYALDHGREIYRTPMLFAPYGVQLSLHTHATIHSLIAWPWTGLLGSVGSHNLAIACGLVLNGFVTFLLARAALGIPGLKAGPTLAPVVAGLVFALSASVQSRVLGHINLVHAWVLPLFALALLRLERRPVTVSAMILGAAGAVVVYTDYYYATYAAIFLVCWTANNMLITVFTPRPPVFPVLRRALLALLVADALLIAIIVVTRGAAVDLGPFTLSMRGVRNPLTAFWILLALWIACRFPRKLLIRQSTHARLRWLRLSLVAGMVLLVLTAPLWIALASVIAQGDYTTQQVLWRSSPAGVDAATLLLGHPAHLVTGRWTLSAYGALGIDRMEQSLWLGIIPVVLLVATRDKWSRLPAARFWTFTGVAFLLLALGPFLRIAGYDTALPLPQALLRYVPGFSNARIPGRAVVMVSLALAMLTCFALAHLQRSRLWIAVAAAALLIVEALPAAAPVYRVPARDAIDVLLRETKAEGSVAELPLGLRDGLGESGRLDHRALAHQIWHERPLAGGFVARLPSSVKERYLASSVLKDLVDISTPAKQGGRLSEDARREAVSLGITFVIVNRDTFVGQRLRQADLEHAGFVLLRTAGTRELYAAPLDEHRER